MMNDSTDRQSDDDDATGRGVAPADARVRARWPAWKVGLAYAVMFGVAVGSIWVIDGHVLEATPAATMPASTTVAR